MADAPVGKLCLYCRRKHRTVDIESVPMSLRREIKKLDRHIYPKGYLGSLIREDSGEVWDFFAAIAETRAPEQFRCPLCGKLVSKEEHQEYLGYHADCFYIEEIQDADYL